MIVMSSDDFLTWGWWHTDDTDWTDLHWLFRADAAMLELEVSIIKGFEIDHSFQFQIPFFFAKHVIIVYLAYLAKKSA